MGALDWMDIRAFVQWERWVVGVIFHGSSYVLIEIGVGCTNVLNDSFGVGFCNRYCVCRSCTVYTYVYKTESYNILMTVVLFFKNGTLIY